MIKNLIMEQNNSVSISVRDSNHLTENSSYNSSSYSGSVSVACSDKNSPNSQIEKKYSSIYKLNKIEMFLMDKVEIIYINLKNETRYHKLLKIIFFIFSIVSYSFLFSFLFIFGKQRQNIYCFNMIYNQFELCSIDQACSNSTIGIYDNSNLSNVSDFNNELLNVNKKYQNLFSKKNNNNNFKFVILTENEQANIFLKYNDSCNFYSTNLIFGMSILIGIVISNLTCGLLSDIYGRKKIFIIFGLICSASCFLFFGLIMNLDKTNSNINDEFNKYKLSLALVLLLINFSNSTAQNSVLCKVLENSISDNLVSKNFSYYCNGIILSIIYTYSTIYPFNEFKYYFLISGILILLTVIIVIVYIFESPRQLYEYSEWINYTNFFDSIFDNKNDNLKSLYSPRIIYEETSRMEKEFIESRKMLIKQNCIKNNYKCSFISRIMLELKLLKESLKKNQNFFIKREDLIKNPLLIYSYLVYDKLVRENHPIFLAYLIIVFLIFNITTINYFSTYFFTREGLFSIYFVNSSFLYLTLVLLLSNFIFYFFRHFFGFKRVMTLCFLSIIVFSLIIDFPLTMVPYSLADINKFNYDLLSNYYRNYEGQRIRICLYFLSFFQFGLFYNTYIYFLKYTKTIFRCTFFGAINLIDKLCLFSALFITMFLERSLLISAIASFMGLFTILFLSDKDEDINLICDKKREIFKK